ncbi:MAG TPA: hypothetical protein VMU55_02040 [Solirubrobacteraceae bacterium]|nr:hypothetical protein [Solirubrobacteraceae bacterium]
MRAVPLLPLAIDPDERVALLVLLICAAVFAMRGATRRLRRRLLLRAQDRIGGDQALVDRALLERIAGELATGKITLEQRARMLHVSTAELSSALQRTNGIVPAPPTRAPR